MYAVVRTGGKQVRIQPGQVVRVEKLDGAVGESVELSEVLMVGGEGDARVGTPLVEGARVVTTITEQGRGKKVRLFKLKRRKGYRRKQGHRQAYTALKVESIEAVKADVQKAQDWNQYLAPFRLGGSPEAEMRQSLGIAVFAGMIGVTIFGLLFTPTFYVMCRALGRFRRGRETTPAHEASTQSENQTAV